MFVIRLTKATVKLEVQEGSLTITGEIDVSAYLALEASVKLKDKFEKELVVLPLPSLAFGVAGYFTIGPALTLAAKGSFEAAASGGLLMGGKASLDKVYISIDILKQNSFKQSGLVPKFTQRFDAFGEITAEARLGLPVTVAAGLRIPKLDFKRELGITSEASVFAKGTYQVQYNSTDVECNNGINWIIGVDEEVTADILGFKTFDIYKTNLANKTGCYQ